MSGEDNVGVTLAHVDPFLVSCWDKMVKRGEECSLLLKHSKGKVVATLQCTTPVRTSTSLPSLSPSALEKKKKKKKRKGAKKRKLEKLLAYHQRLVVEKGLPPSRLMEEQAALSTPPPAKSSSGSKFECDRCDFVSDTQHGLKVHMGKSHKNTEVLRDEEHEVSLVLSEPSDEVRDDISTVGCANNDLQGQEMKGQNNEGVSSFISALKNTFNLWPEDDPPHRCHPWEPCRNLKCRVKAEIENQEYAAAGECDDCGENVNDCECGS